VLRTPHWIDLGFAFGLIGTRRKARTIRDISC